MTKFRELIDNHKTELTQKYPDINSLHEAYALLLEEMDEFWDIVKLKPAFRDNDKLLEELVQIATLTELTAEMFCCAEIEFERFQKVTLTLLKNQVFDIVSSSGINTIKTNSGTKYIIELSEEDAKLLKTCLTNIPH